MLGKSSTSSSITGQGFPQLLGGGIGHRPRLRPRSGGSAAPDVALEAPRDVHTGERLDRDGELGQNGADVLSQATSCTPSFARDEHHLEGSQGGGGVSGRGGGGGGDQERSW